MKKWKALKQAKKALVLFYLILGAVCGVAAAVIALAGDGGRAGLFTVLAVCFALLALIHLLRGNDDKSVL